MSKCLIHDPQALTAVIGLVTKSTKRRLKPRDSDPGSTQPGDGLLAKALTLGDSDDDMDGESGWQKGKEVRRVFW